MYWFNRTLSFELLELASGSRLKSVFLGLRFALYARSKVEIAAK
jgi:hypothetical protein